MIKRNVLHSPRLAELKKGRRMALLNKILILLLGLAVIFILSAYLSSLSSLNIKEIQIIGNKIIDTEVIKSAVEEQIAGKYLWFFPKTNILFYPKNKIKNELRNKFKRIKDINLSIQSGGNNKTLLVTISEREAKYTWCGEVIPVLNSNSDQKCYFMDVNGYIFDEAPYFSGGVYFKFYGNTNFNGENPSGFYFLQDKFMKIISFKDAIKGMGLDPIAFWLDNIGNANFSLSKEPTVGPTIIFKPDADLAKVAENLQAALFTEPFKSKFKNKYSLFQYVDLRFENKVYSKFND